MSAAAKALGKLTAQKVGAGGTAEPAGKIKPPDDVVAEVAGMVGEAVEKTASSACTAVIDRFNADHFVSVEGGKTAVYRNGFDYELNRGRLDRMAVEAFRALHSHETIRIPSSDGNTRKVCIADVWLRDPRRKTYPDGMALLPDGKVPPGVYNLWRGWPCEPKRGATREDVKPALVHILKVICGDDRKAFDYFIGWLAYGVQNPGKQAEVAIVLQGGRGTGKGTIGRWFRDLYGQHGMHITHARHLTGNFNAHLRNTLAAFVDESFFVGDKAGNSVLKTLITEDQNPIEKKGVDVFSVRNRIKIIMASNEEHVVIAGVDERRFFVLQVSDVKKQDKPYFAKLDAWWSNGGKEALLGFLLEYDLTGFDVRTVPNTAALERQKLESLDMYNRWIFEKLSDGRWEQGRTPEQWAFDFKAYAEEHGGTRYINTSANSVGMRLRTAGIEMQKVRQSSGERKNVWKVPELKVARQCFSDKFGLTYHQWDTDAEDNSAE